MMLISGLRFLFGRVFIPSAEDDWTAAPAGHGVRGKGTPASRGSVSIDEGRDPALFHCWWTGKEIRDLRRKGSKRIKGIRGGTDEG